jgi:hypothetical protein
MQAVDISNITKVYSGKAGTCMCGCAGKYSYTAKGAVEDSPGYDVSDSVNERSVKIIAGKVLRNSNTDLSDVGYAVLEQNERVLVVFFKV